MKNKIWAFVAYNLYAGFILSAFQENTPYLFDAQKAFELKSLGLIEDIREWGWNDHYIWRLFSGLVVTALAGFLAGGFSKDKGGKVAALSNIPSIIVWMIMLYIMAFGDQELPGKTGFIVISLLAIPLTTYVAFKSGEAGEEVQRNSFKENTIFGVRSSHYIWALFPIYWYSLGIVYVFTKFIAFQLMNISDMSIFAAIKNFLFLIPVIAWVYPLVLVYRVLSGDMMLKEPSYLKAFANIGILIGGAAIATGLQYITYWTLQNIL
jgi:hypothetical protein